MFGHHKKTAMDVDLLSEKTCQPCTAESKPLSGEHLDEMLAQVPGWACQDDKKISRLFRFADWAGAADFANRVAELAQSEGHHPDIHLSWGKVTVECYTHKIKGLSENDFILASKVNQLFEGSDLV